MDQQFVICVFICGFILVKRSTGAIMHADWMSKLSRQLLDTPLRGVAIPGSHDSASYSLNATNGLAPGIPDKIQGIINASKTLLGGEQFVKREVYRWSVTQSYNITQQLQIGIRYFDLRVLYKDLEDKLYTYHGLIGAPLKTILAQMAEFLQKHQKEVLFLDFNHLYILTNKGMQRLVSVITTTLGDKLFHRKNKEPCLSDLWREHKNVIVFFRGVKQKFIAGIEEETNFAFNDSQLLSPFEASKFYEYSTWMKFLKEHYSSRPHNHTFYVTQGIMQPNILSIAASSLTKTGSLETLTSDQATTSLVKWLPTCKSGTDGINIVIADFVQKHNFTETVLSLNLSNSSSTNCIQVLNLMLRLVLVLYVLG